MSGWRLGWGIMNKNIANMMSRLNGNITSCASTISQQAAIQALDGDTSSTDIMLSKFRDRRDFIIKGLNKIPGFKASKPSGAFYAFPNIEKTKMRSVALANYLLDKAGVALLPGTGFGKYGEGYLRISYANSKENLQKALDRIKKAMKERE